MSAFELSEDHGAPTVDGGELYEDPVFDLEYAYDNLQRPEEITVSAKDAGADIFTSWLTAPVEIVLPVRECR